MIRLGLLRSLRWSFGVQGALQKTLFDSAVASAIFFGVVSSITTADRKRLDKLTKKVLGCPPVSVQAVGEKEGYS